MFKTLLSALTVGALALGASSASANTVVFDPLNEGVDVISQSGSENYLSVDLNRDGVNDIRLGIFTDGFGTAAFLRAIRPEPQFPVSPDPSEGEGEMPPELTEFPRGEFEGGEGGEGPGMGGGLLALTQRVLISDVLYEEGDSVSAGDFTDNTLDYLFGRNTSSAVNLLANLNDSALFGFQIEIGEASFDVIDGFEFNNFEGETQTFYAFLQITHGSIRIGQAGYNSVAGQSVTATLSPVPLPAGAVLLLGALGGLGAMRMRRRA